MDLSVAVCGLLNLKYFNLRRLLLSNQQMNLKSKMKHYLKVKVCLQNTPGPKLNDKVAGLAQVEYLPEKLKALKQAALMNDYFCLKYLKQNKKKIEPSSKSVMKSS